jgi:hypothetical protein
MEGRLHGRFASLYPFPQAIKNRFWQIVKKDPYIASRRTSKVFSSDLLEFLWEFGAYSVRVERLRT